MVIVVTHSPSADHDHHRLLSIDLCQCIVGDLLPLSLSQWRSFLAFNFSSSNSCQHDQGRLDLSW